MAFRNETKRKSSEEPYFVHPKGVAKIVMNHGGTEDQICAAFLHDLLEDVPAVSYEDIAKGFSEHIADLVLELTNVKAEIAKIGKEDYMSQKLCKISNEALLVKLSDMLYNINDKPTDAQQTRMLANLKEVLLKRKDLDTNCHKLAIEVFGS